MRATIETPPRPSPVSAQAGIVQRGRIEPLAAPAAASASSSALPRAQHVAGDGPIQQPGIEIGKPAACAMRLASVPLPDGGGSVDGDDHRLQFLRETAARP